MAGCNYYKMQLRLHIEEAVVKETLYTEAGASVLIVGT